MKTKTYLASLGCLMLAWLPLNTVQAQNCCPPPPCCPAPCCDPCACEPLGIDLQITNGYRQDCIKSTVNQYALPAVVVGSASTSGSGLSGTDLLFSDHLKADNINFYQLGGRARWSACNFLIRADGDYAWGSGGNFTTTRDAFTVGVVAPVTTVTKAKINDATAYDFTIGAGYLFTFENCGCEGYLDGFAIGPVAGWTYNHQEFKLKGNATDTDDITSVTTPSVLDGLKYQTRWQGPWLGFDIVYKGCSYAVNFGYSYHWATRHASFKLDPASLPFGIPNFSNTTNSNNASGNEVFLNGEYYFCDSWSVGLGFKYVYYCADKGKAKLDTPVVPAIETARVHNAQWQSYAITLDLGYKF